MLSRVAETLYWTGRYIERGENIARFIDVNIQMSLDAPLAFSEQWEPLVEITGDTEGFTARYAEPTRENVIAYLTLDAENQSSIMSCISQARENARSVRDVISTELWEQINRFHLLVSNEGAGRLQRDAQQFLEDVRLTSQLLQGVTDNTMSHSEPWHFLRLGRMIERADNISRLLDVKYYLLLPSVEDVGGSIDEMQWAFLLRSASALQMYRRRHGAIEPERAIEFLLLDQEFPRAVRFCLVRAEESLRAISGSRPGRFSNGAEQRIGRLHSELAYSNVYDIIGSGLHEFLDGFQQRLNGVGDAIGECFFRTDRTELSSVRGNTQRDVLSGYQGEGRTGSNSRYAGRLGQ